MSLPFTIKDYIEANKRYNNLSDKDREQMNKILESNFSKKEIDNLFKHFPNWKKIIKGNNNE